MDKLIECNEVCLGLFQFGLRFTAGLVALAIVLWLIILAAAAAGR